MLCGYESELGLSEPRLSCVEGENNGPISAPTSWQGKLPPRWSCPPEGAGALGSCERSKFCCNPVPAFLAPPVLNSALSTLVASGIWGLVSLPDMLTEVPSRLPTDGRISFPLNEM